MTLPATARKFGNHYFLDLNDDERAELNRHVNGSGGYETFLRALQKLVNNGTGTIKLTDADIEGIAHQAFDSGNGGFEARLLRIFARTLGPRLGRDDET